MCDACTPKNVANLSKVSDKNPDLPSGRALEYKMRIPDEVFDLPLEEYMGFITRSLDRQWSALYDLAKEAYIKHNEGLLDPREFTKP
jgi:hypothetical protein